jgi:hypothetical protein
VVAEVDEADVDAELGGRRRAGVDRRAGRLKVEVGGGEALLAEDAVGASRRHQLRIDIEVAGTRRHALGAVGIDVVPDVDPGQPAGGDAEAAGDVLVQDVVADQRAGGRQGGRAAASMASTPAAASQRPDLAPGCAIEPLRPAR